MKIVLDTNVLIAALIARGICSSLLEHCIQFHSVIGSDFILGELRGHLVGKFHYSIEEANEAVAILKAHMDMVTPAPLEGAICRDPDDIMILATAATGGAACVVTGDKDLLILQQFRNIRILRPAEFSTFEAQSEALP